MSPAAEIATSARRVAVIGGGVVGVAAALLAERCGAQVWLFESNRPAVPSSAPEHDLAQWPIRHVALSPASLNFLDQLGVAQTFAHGVFRQMQVWEQWGTALLAFDAAELARGELGVMAELPSLLAVLWQRVAQVSGIVPIFAEAVTDLVRNTDNTWTLHHGGRQTTVELVLAADGARSAARQSLGVAVSRADTGHEALATVVRTSQAHGEIARQRFLVDGPLALLPSRSPRVVSIVWSASPEQSQRRLRLGATEFCAELTAASESVLGSVEAVGQRAAFPVVQQLAATFAPQPGAVLVGDAGRVVHPLAGLGVNLGLEDVAALEPLLQANGSADWSAWARRRRARSRLVASTLTALRKTYSNAAPGPSLLRNAGVRLLGGSTLLRQFLVREALGL